MKQDKRKNLIASIEMDGRKISEKTIRRFQAFDKLNLSHEARIEYLIDLYSLPIDK